ncbi:MAG: phosphotransferase [Roseococcus sp.]
MLRRPPRPPYPPSTHDVVREARLQLALAPLGVRVPPVLAVCEDESVLGVPFYVMAYVDGQVLTDTLPAPLLTIGRLRFIPGQRECGEARFDGHRRFQSPAPAGLLFRPFGDVLTRKWGRPEHAHHDLGDREDLPLEDSVDRLG